MTEFSVFIPLHGIAPGNSWLEEVIIWKTNTREKNKKKKLEDFTCTMDKIDRYGGNKIHRLYRCHSNCANIVDNGLRIYGEGRTQISLISPAMIGPLARIQDRQSLY